MYLGNYLSNGFPYAQRPAAGPYKTFLGFYRGNQAIQRNITPGYSRLGQSSTIFGLSPTTIGLGVGALFLLPMIFKRR